MRQPELRIQDARYHPKRYCSITTASEYLCVGWRTIIALIDEGKLEARTIGKRRKVLVSSIAAYESTAEKIAS